MSAGQGERPESGRATVVIGVDGSEPSFEALARAAAVVAATGARAVVVFVRHLPPLITSPSGGEALAVMADTLDALEEKARERASAILLGAGVDFAFESRVGDPAHEIIAVAHEQHASLVVVGASIHGPVASVVLSSVASHLLHHCDISVAIVRPTR